MKKIVVAATVFVALAGAPAQAQATRTFVSPTGNDASPTCSLTAPCRTFVGAYALTNAGGEIAVLGTAGYGALTISKAISIVNGGGFEAGISVPSGGTGIIINAETHDAVSLRGLTIDGAGVGLNGIQFNSGASLTVENCVIRHMTGDGIDFLSSTATSALTVSNTLVADNSAIGVKFRPTGSGIAVFNRVEVTNNPTSGIAVFGNDSAAANTINATVFESVAANNGDGFFAETLPGKAPTSLMISHSVAANNSVGVTVNMTGATLRLANSTITGNNSHGWFVDNSGLGATYGDNYIDGNGTNMGALTPVARQ
jgi:Right handed beta helix region